MSLRFKLLSGLKWAFSGQILVQIFDLLFTAVLSRILLPKEFGLFALVFVVLNLFNNLNNLGFGSALIQKKTLNRIELSSVFWFSTFTGSAMALVLFLMGGTISIYFHEPNLQFILQIVAINFIISSLGAVPSSLLQKELKFKQLFFIRTFATILSGVVAVVMAYQGYGVMSLVSKMIFASFITVVCSFIYTRFSPSLTFRWIAMKPFFHFGWPILINSLLGYGLRNLDSILIGRKFSTVDLGYYNKSYQLMVLPLTNITTILSRVLFPALSSEKDELKHKRAYSESVSMVSFLSFPAMFGLMVVANDTILIIYGPQWEQSVIYLKILCITGAFQPIAAMAGNYYLLKAKTFMSLKVSTFSRVFMMVSMVAGSSWGPIGIAIGYTVSSLIAFVPEIYFSALLVNLSLLEVLQRLVRNLIITLIMTLVVYSSGFFLIELEMVIWRLLIQVIVGASIYLSLSWFFNREVVLKFVSLFRKVA